MDMLYNIKEKISADGFAVMENIFSNIEVADLLHIISQADTSKPTFRKTNDLFAIRQFFKEIPASVTKVFNDKFITLIESIFGTGYFVVKSIYFDKPANSNWFVAYHQDLTISVDQKTDIPGFGPWTKKENQFAVQPPLAILEDNFTIRIHLDDTTEANGALKVIAGSHVKGITRATAIDHSIEKEITCAVPKGGVMLMKPLLLHSSGRTTNNNKRRVLHIEFSRLTLPHDLQWSERIDVAPTFPAPGSA